MPSSPREYKAFKRNSVKGEPDKPSEVQDDCSLDCTSNDGFNVVIMAYSQELA